MVSAAYEGRGGCKGCVVVVLRVGIPGHAVLLLPDGYGLQVKRVTREQIRRAEGVEIAVIDQRAGEVREGSVDAARSALRRSRRAAGRSTQISR